MLMMAMALLAAAPQQAAQPTTATPGAATVAQQPPRPRRMSAMRARRVVRPRSATMSEMRQNEAEIDSAEGNEAAPADQDASGQSSKN